MVDFANKNIVIEGPIGVGKSSLARRLASTLNAELLLEDAASNPFLERYYAQPERYALATQLYFLYGRVRQLNQLSESLACGTSASQQASPDNRVHAMVADYMLEKDPLFAQLTLDPDEYQLYLQAYKSVVVSKPAVDLVIYLQAPVAVLQERVNRRRVRYEMSMDLEYLQRLSTGYTEYFHHYKDSALLIVNAAEINPVDNDQHYAELVKQIIRIDAGKHFFNPLAEAL